MEVRDIVKTQNVNSAKELFDYLLYGNYRYKNTQFLFRGLSSDNYRLIPSALRQENTEKLMSITESISNKGITGSNFPARYQIYMEYSFLRSFYQGCNEFGLPLPDMPDLNKSIFRGNHFLPSSLKIWIPEDYYNLASLAQHYGVFTRLLDWTTDFLTALYFACQIDSVNPPKNVVLWILNPYVIEFFKSSSIRLPLRFVFPNYHNNQNITAQRGLFSLWEIPIPQDKPHVDRRPLDSLLESEMPKHEEFRSLHKFLVLEKIIIPARIINDVLEVLSIMNYSEAKIFPGYGGVAKWIMNSNVLKPKPVTIGFPTE